MNDPLLTKNIGNYRYQVYYDHDDYIEHYDAEYAEYLQSSELESYIVVKLALCKSCSNWHDIDCLGSIHAADELKALEDYLTTHDLTTYKEET